MLRNKLFLTFFLSCSLPLVKPWSTIISTGRASEYSRCRCFANNARTKSAEELVAPIRDNLIDFDYAQLMCDEVNASLTSIPWLGIHEVQLERSIGEGHIVDKLDRSNASAVLVMTGRYYLSENFDKVVVEAAPLMFPNAEALIEFKEKLGNDKDLTEDTDCLYRSVITAEVGIDGTIADSNKDFNAESLSSETGSIALINALRSAAKQAAEEIAVDIELDETYEH